LPVDAPLNELLSEEILITGEVYEVADRALERVQFSLASLINQKLHPSMIESQF